MTNVKIFTIALFATVCLLCQNVQAGNYTPTLVDGRTWNLIEVYYNYPSPDTVYHQLRVDGMEHVDGYNCFRVFGDNLVMSYMREADGKIMVKQNDEWKVQFDFGLQPGERFDETGLVVENVSYVDICGKPCRCLQFGEFGLFGEEYCWIEGIGDSYTGPFRQDIVSGNLMFGVVLSCYDGDVCIYDMATGLVPSSVSTIPASHGDAARAVYDLQGRRISGKPSHGMYIVNGRKYAVGR